MFRACELKDQTYKKTRSLHFSEFKEAESTLNIVKLGIFKKNKLDNSLMNGRVIDNSTVYYTTGLKIWHKIDQIFFLQYKKKSQGLKSSVFFSLFYFLFGKLRHLSFYIVNPFLANRASGEINIANRRFEAIRVNRSHVMEIGFPRESIRANRPGSRCESPGRLSSAAEKRGI